jgi:hypothetical protein
MARGLLPGCPMALSFIPHGQLKHYGITQDAVRGLRHRLPEESWPLPQHAKGRLRLFLDDLGFEVSREIWVREMPAQCVFRLYQPSRDAEKDVKAVGTKRYRLSWLRDALLI